MSTSPETGQHCAACGKPVEDDGFSGVTEALELFLAERGTQLMRTAVLLAGGRQDGEDLVQAALVGASRPSSAISSGLVARHL